MMSTVGVICSEAAQPVRARTRRDNGGMNTNTPTIELRLSEGAPWQLAPLEEATQPRRFSGIAHSGKPFGSGMWKTVMDFEGIRLKDKTAVLIDHDGRQRAGVCTLSVVSDGLKAEGVLLDNEYGQAVARESDAGFPWEMSVYVQAGRVEELPVGASATVNGHTLAGPMLVMRGCTIREVSFTAVGVDGNTHAAALSGLIPESPNQAGKDCKMSMTPEEKAEFDQLKADKAVLEQELADLKKRKKKADVDGKLSAAGFKQGEDGKFSGLSDATYAMLLSADDNTLSAVIADIAPKAEAKPEIPEALLSDKQGGQEPEAGVKLSAATGESSFSKGKQYV
ncbi:hypothetical protein [Kingella potus]|nr:hypothetical protein [Kingella potus]UOP00538.1 hypothetical protein LVJ84_11960 [Kingella potus]UOP02010.1 hypothetical protein LVJ84_14650 [Kingella potus]